MIHKLNLALLTGNLRENLTGIGTYTFQFADKLPINRDCITFIKHKSGDYLKGCNYYDVPYPLNRFSYLLWSNSVSLCKKKISKFEIVHNVAQYPISPSINENYIVTIHDLIPVLYPDYVTKFFAIQARLYMPILLKKSKRIIAVSNSTKNDIIRRYSISPEKIDVIYEGVSNHFKVYAKSYVSNFRRHYGLGRPFILFVGALEPKKNIETLIKAYYRAIKVIPDLDLVIAGKKAWKYKSIFNVVNQLNLQKKVKFLNFIPYDELPLLYNAAELFVFPSLYEGFGLPPIEAMRCGVPVIVSNRSSLPEIVGNNGVIVDPLNFDQLSREIIKVLTDHELNRRLRLESIERSSLFTWENCSKATLSSYEKAMDT